VTFKSTINGAYNLTVNDSGTTTFAGEVGMVGTALTSLTTDAAGQSIINTNQIKTTGAQFFYDNLTFSQVTTLTVGTVTFGGTVGSAHALTVDGNAVFGTGTGNTVTLTGAGSNLSVSGTTLIKTSSISTAGTQIYTGAVTLATDVTLTATGVGALGNIIFGSTVDSVGSTPYSLKLTTDAAATATFTDKVGYSHALSNMSVAGPSKINGGVVTTTGTQTYMGAVTMGQGAVFTSSGTGVAGNITFASTISGPYALTINTPSVITLSDVLGSLDIPLTSVVICNTGSACSPGSVVISGGAVFTSSIQTYNTPVVLNATVTTFNSAANILFGGTLDSYDNSIARRLTINTGSATTASTTLSNAVGGQNPIGDISITTGILTAAAIAMNASSTLTVTNSSPSSGSAITGIIQGSNAALVKNGVGTLTLSGANTYSGGTTINTGILQAGSNSIVSGSSITSGSMGTGGVAVNSGTSFDLNGQVVANILSVTGTGTSNNGALLNSSASAATSSGAITLAGDTTIQNTGALTLSGLMDGGHILTITTKSTGAVTLSGAIGSVTPLTSISTNASSGNAGVTLSGTSINSVGTMTFGNAVSLGADTTLTTTATGSAGNVTFSSTVDSANTAPHSLTLTTDSAATTTFTSAVGATYVLNNLSVAGLSAINGGAVKTNGTQTYTGAVTLGGTTALTTVTSSSGGTNTNATVSFSSTVDSSAGNYYGLTITNGNGNVSFGNNVGGLSSNTALGSLTITGGGTTTSQTTTLNGNVITAGNQSFGGNLTLAGASILTSTANVSNGSVTIAGAVGGAPTTSILMLFANGAYTLNGVSYTASATATTVNSIFGATLIWNNTASTYTFNPGSSNAAASILVVGGGGRSVG